MLTLFPQIKPYTQHQLAVEPPHQLYIEECGNPRGVPVLVVHDGPGMGCDASLRCYFDPERYRIILFDQRGAGRSTPHAQLNHNSTSALLSDMEAIREFLDIERWLFFAEARHVVNLYHGKQQC